MRIAAIAAAIAVALMPFHAAGQTAKTKSVLQANITQDFPDQNAGAITPSVMRSFLNDSVASWQQYPAVNIQTGTTYTAQASDYGAVVIPNNASPFALSVPTPTGSSGSFGIGYNFYVYNKGAGAVTITPSGATINGSASISLAQNQNVWVISDGSNYQVWNNPAGGSATVTSVGLTMPGSIFGVTGSPVTTAGTLAVSVTGNSGGIPYFSSGTALGSTSALTAGGVVYGGGAGVAPATTSAGAAGSVLVGGATPSFSAAPTLGTAGSVQGSLTFANLTSGTVTLSPVNGALGSSILVMPASSATLATLGQAGQVITGGATVTSQSQTTGNITVDCGSRPLQYITNGGAFTITAPSSDGSCILLVTNNASAGSITFSGFSVGSNTGDALNTTNTNKFSIHIWRVNGTSGYRVAAHQ